MLLIQQSNWQEGRLRPEGRGVQKMVGGEKRQISASTSKKVKRGGSFTLQILGRSESIKTENTAFETSRENVTAHRKLFKEAVALYRSAIAEVRPSDGSGVMAFTLTEVFEMENEVGGTLTTLQTQFLKLHSDLRKHYGCAISIVLDTIEEERKEAEADRVKFEADKAADRVRFEDEKAQAEEEAKACHICMEKPHDVVIFPCLHAHYCNDCLKKQKTCPTCRTPIVSTLRYKL